MKTMSLLAAVLALGLTFGVGDADAAKRTGTAEPTPAAVPIEAPPAAV